MLVDTNVAQAMHKRHNRCVKTLGDVPTIGKHPQTDMPRL